jgi:hypothetical protein
MKVTRDVVSDLLPLVLAGEASADSKALVESYLGEDPEFARIVDERSRPAPENVPAPLAKEVEMKTLERTKQLMSWRSVLIAVAVFFALFPVRFSAHRGPRWMPVEDPLGSAITVAIALAAFGGFLWIRHSLRGRMR